MATWSLLQNLTTFDLKSVCTDGTDIYFVQYGGGAEYHVFKYDVSLDSVSQISNAASWGGTSPQLTANAAGGLIGSCIQWFKNDLYAVVFTTDASNVRVYRYDGSGTSWTEVLAMASPDVAGEYALYSDADYLIVAPDSRIDYNFTWAEYSADGSSWSAASVGNSPAPVGQPSRYSTTYGQGVSPVFIDTSSHNISDPDPDAIYRWFEWAAGTFAITQYTEFTGGAWSPPDSWLRSGAVLVDVLIWFSESGTWKYAAALGDTPVAPSGGDNYPIVTLGPLGQQAGDAGGDVVILSDGVWGSAETVGSGGLSHLVVLSGGAGFLFGESGAEAAIWGRSDPFPLPTDEFRFLGLDADPVNLYATANDRGTLKLIAYNLETLVQTSEAAFGAATFAELDARTRGIFPVAKPGNDGMVFARGRDGNNKQVLLSDDYGATFADAGDAGWAADKYCVGLLPDPLRPDDLVACFGDNDLYRSEDGAGTWSKAGDAPATLRAAARHPTTPEELLLGAQAEDTLYWTGNLGVSFEDVSDVAVEMVNVIVGSRE